LKQDAASNNSHTRDMQTADKVVPRARKEIKLTPADEARFWSQVDKLSEPNGCWLWIGRRQPSGYGWFILPGINNGRLTHRVAWTLVNGPIPNDSSYHGICVYHNCPGGDRRDCVNPSHMFLGTHADNMRDMDKKGRRKGRGVGNCHKVYPRNKVTRREPDDSHIKPKRFARGDKHGLRLHPERISRGMAHGLVMQRVAARGEKHKCAKLTAEQVREIRNMYSIGSISQRRLAMQFNVSQTVIGDIVHLKSWTHI